MRAAFALALVATLGCAQLLGLEEGTDKPDAVGGGAGQAGGGASGGAGGDGGGMGGAGGAVGVGGGGGMAPPACGSLAKLSDDFEGTVLDPQWEKGTEGGEAVQLGGQFMLAQDAAGYALLRSRRMYQLHGSSVTVRLEDLVVEGAGNEVTIQLHALDLSYDVSLRVRENETQPFSAIGGTGVAAAGPASAYPWLRIEESGGTLRWLRSTDGTDFVSIRESPTNTVLPDGFVRLTISAIVTGGAGSASAAIDEVNVPGVSVPWCAMSSLVDTFDVATALWGRSSGSISCSVAVGNGEVNLAHDGTLGPGPCELGSSSAYDLSNGRVTVRALSVDTTTQMTLRYSNDRFLSIRYELGGSDELVVETEGGDLARIPYDATDHAYWGFEDDGNNRVAAIVSADGLDWNTLAVANNQPLDDAAVFLGVTASSLSMRSAAFSALSTTPP